MKNKIVFIILIAFIFRLILLIINNYWFILPQGGADAIRFERNAYFLSISNYPISFLDIISNGVRLHVWLGSIIYSIFGRSPMIWGLIFVILGVFTVFNIHKGVYLLTNQYKFANRMGLFAAIFPNFAVLSALLLREVPIHFFLSLALLHFIKYNKFNSNESLIKFLIFGFIAGLFHTGVMFLLFGFIFYQVVLNKKSKTFSKIFFSILFFAALIFLNQTGIGLNKIGGSLEAGFEAIQSGTGELNEDAGANYPDWLLLKGGIGDFLIILIRFIAFYFAPLFPFMIRTTSHLLGIIDVLFYIYLAINIFKNRSILFNSQVVKGILSMALFVSLTFTVGVSNFGTNIRHRAKVLPFILLLPIIKKKEKTKISDFRLNQITK